MMTPEIKCERCRQVTDSLYPAHHGDWYCSQCAQATRLVPTGNPVDARGYYSLLVSETRRELSRYQQELDQACYSTDRARLQGRIQDALSYHDKLQALFQREN